MTDLQWKIERGRLLIKSPPDPFGDAWKGTTAEWRGADYEEAASILQSVIAATQEKCAQVLSARAHWERSAYGNTDGAELLDWGASAVRALKMETGHAGT